MKRWTTMLAATAVAIGISVLGATPAQAADTGGDGNPTECANAYTVASKPIYGIKGPTSGKVIGQLELRWSWACYANWSRVVLYGGMYSSAVTVRQELRAESRLTTSEDYGLKTGSSGTSAWTRYLRLSNSQSTACTQVWLSSNFGTLNFHTVGASLCA